MSHDHASTSAAERAHEDTEPALAQLLALANGDGTLAAWRSARSGPLPSGKQLTVCHRGRGEPWFWSARRCGRSERRHRRQAGARDGVWLGPGEVAVFPPGKPCPSSVSARGWRRWAGGWSRCGGSASSATAQPTRPPRPS